MTFILEKNAHIYIHRFTHLERDSKSGINVQRKGISKIEEQCAKAGLPAPTFTNEGSDFWVIFRKDVYNKEDLSKLGLNERQIKAVLYAKEKEKITNKEYQEINEVSERTASRELSELVKANILEQGGSFGAGSFYKLKTP